MKKNLIAENAEDLLTLEEYNGLSPLEQGFASYMQSSWEESNIPGKNPYNEGTEEFEEFKDGSFRAMIVAQDFEE